jgi:hypothetical protein
MPRTANFFLLFCRDVRFYVSHRGLGIQINSPQKGGYRQTFALSPNRLRRKILRLYKRKRGYHGLRSIFLFSSVET